MRRVAGTVASDEAGQRLDRWLERRLADALGQAPSRAAVRRLVMAGAVAVDARVSRRPGAPLRAGMRIEARVDTGRLGPPPSERAAASLVGPERFLYRDAFVLAVDKPPGLPMHASADRTRPNLYDLVKEALGGRPYLGLHQRLDRDTSGVVLFTLDPAANAGLADAIATGRVAKTYHALCARPARMPPGEWRESGPLGGDGPNAETAFRVIRTLPARLMIEARPTTGRKHQIRIHLAGRGLPILGDRRYGAHDDAPRVMLHALRLELAHPVTGERLSVASPYPDDFQARLVTPPGPRARS